MEDTASVLTRYRFAAPKLTDPPAAFVAVPIGARKCSATHTLKSRQMGIYQTVGYVEVQRACGIIGRPN
jgi:hypothetical protein